MLIMHIGVVTLVTATCVLSILQVHDLSSSAQHELVRGQLGWEPWSGTLYPGQGIRAAAGSSPALAGTSLKIQLQLGGLGVSIVSQQAELLYGRITGIQARAVTGVARQTLQLALQQLQVWLNSQTGHIAKCRCVTVCTAL